MPSEPARTYLHQRTFRNRMRSGGAGLRATAAAALEGRQGMGRMILLLCVSTCVLVLITSRLRFLEATGLRDFFCASSPRPTHGGDEQLGTQPELQPALAAVLQGHLSKSQRFRADDPHLCVLVSTYRNHGVRLTALLASLLASGYGSLSMILLDTDLKMASMEWMQATADLINGHFDVLGEGEPARKQCHVSHLNQRAVAQMFPGVTNDYGYILSDLVMDELLHGKMEGVAQCDYFMLTNGDNLYSSRLLPSALPYMRTDIDLIGFEFLSHYSIKDNRVDHPGSDQTIHTQFKTLWIDKGAAMFKADTIARLNMTFALGFAREFGRLTTQVLGFKPTRIDGNFFTQLAQTEGVSSVIIRRTLLMHL